MVGSSVCLGPTAAGFSLRGAARRTTRLHFLVSATRRTIYITRSALAMRSTATVSQLPLQICIAGRAASFRPAGVSIRPSGGSILCGSARLLSPDTAEPPVHRKVAAVRHSEAIGHSEAGPPPLFQPQMVRHSLAHPAAVVRPPALSSQQSVRGACGGLQTLHVFDRKNVAAGPLPGHVAAKLLRSDLPHRGLYPSLP